MLTVALVRTYAAALRGGFFMKKIQNIEERVVIESDGLGACFLRGNSLFFRRVRWPDFVAGKHKYHQKDRRAR